VIPRKSTRAGTQESRRQTQAPAHSVEDPKSRAYKSFDQLAREFVDGNQKIARELGLLAPERNSSKPQYLKRRTKTRIDESHRLHQIVNHTAIRANAGDKEAKAVLTALQAQHEEAIKTKKKLSREDKREDRNRRIASLAKSVLESTNEDETWRYIRSRLDPLDQLAREFVDGNQKIAGELGLLAPERNSCKPQYLKRRTKTRIDECHRL
jgi:hypothetical protein